MRSIAVLPAIALLGGAAYGVHADVPRAIAWSVIPIVSAGWLSWYRARVRLLAVLLAAGFFCAAAGLASDARHRAIDPGLRTVLDRRVGGFLLDTLGPGHRHPPVLTRATLLEDAAESDDSATLRAAVSELQLDGMWVPARGDAVLNVGGSASFHDVGTWRAGRRVEAPVTFRRPARYLDDGVRDFERDLALDGTALFGSIKSGFLVRVTDRAGVVQEAASRIRFHVRRSVERWVGEHDRIASAIVVAVLIGDRTGLPDDVRVRLQAAGTYHVIAISGGNIAILAGLIVGALLVCGVTGRRAAVITLVLLVAYAEIVTSSASVWRATLMAALYLGARLLDHRSHPWNAIGLAAAVIVCVQPLDVRNAGFLLTFGATGALIEVARRTRTTRTKNTTSTKDTKTDAFLRVLRRSSWTSWLFASLAASAAAEIALLPVSAWAFSRITFAGVLLNLVAVPIMGLVQVGGMLACSGIDAVARPAGWMAYLGARVLVDSARLVDAVPWLAIRVPPPSFSIVLAYYGALAAAALTRGLARVVSIGALLACVLVIASGPLAGSGSHLFRLTAFDVGQGDAALMQFPDHSTLLVDTGGLPYGNGGFDLGSRVLAPALWARGVRRLDTVLLTHGDPDHIGGATAVIDDFAPARVWQGIPVAGHMPLRQILADARARGIPVEQQQAGQAMDVGRVRLRVLHPPPPEWARQRVRNDDSVVLEVTYGDVAVLMLGDVGADVERSILPQLSQAPVRILKVAHHGSRTSTSQELLDTWRPQIALISCGRGNTFGHPAPEVIARLRASGATIYRTDLDGEVTIETDGHTLKTRTYIGGKP